MLKLKRILGFVFSTTFLFGFGIILVICCVASVLTEDEESEAVYIEASTTFPSSVEAYRPLVIAACEKYQNKPFKNTCGKLTDYVELALAIMTEESHGSGNDPMQASECGFNTLYPRVHNGITDPTYSIACGVQYMRNALITAKATSPLDFGKIGVAVQGYNFGVEAWCKWIAKKGGNYTVALATEYSDKHMPAGAKGTPNHAEKVLRTYKAALSSAKDSEATEDSTININNIAAVLALNTPQAWELTCGKGISFHPTFSTLPESVISKRLKTITVDVWEFAKSTGTKKKSVKKNITINANLAPFFTSFFKEVYAHKSKIVIHELAGYCYRPKRGSGSLSAHSFGTAIDINWSTAGNGWQVPPLTKKKWEKLKGREKELTIYQGSPLVTIAKKYTLSWGGDWTSVKDPMHFSFIGDVTRD